MSALRVHIAILAGGRSSRMGSDKRFLEIGGESILDRALRIARTWGSRGSGRVLLCGVVEGYSFLGDQIPGLGPLGGLHSAILEMKKEEPAEDVWLLLMPVDMPKLNHPLFDELVRPLLILTSEELAELDGIRFDGFELPCLFKVTKKLEKVLAEVLNETSASARSIRHFSECLNLRTIPLKSDYLSCMENVNTPEDLIRVRRV